MFDLKPKTGQALPPGWDAIAWRSVDGCEPPCFAASNRNTLRKLYFHIGTSLSQAQKHLGGDVTFLIAETNSVAKPCLCNNNENIYITSLLLNKELRQFLQDVDIQWKNLTLSNILLSFLQLCYSRGSKRCCGHLAGANHSSIIEPKFQLQCFR